MVVWRFEEMVFRQVSKLVGATNIVRPAVAGNYGTVANSKLATLRKKTGFPIGKCKEALSQSLEDVDQAEKWLYERAQAEGWAKVDKLKERTASQGLIGLMMKGNKAAMLEVSDPLPVFSDVSTCTNVVVYNNC